MSVDVLFPYMPIALDDMTHLSVIITQFYVTLYDTKHNNDTGKTNTP